MRLFVDNLTNLDFSYLHATRGVVGETWLASIELIGELDEQGMVCDFGIVKKMLREWLDTEIDHRLLVPTETTELTRLKTTSNKHELTWKDKVHDESYFIEAPKAAVALVKQGEITPESVANWCLSQLKALFPNSVREIRLRFTTERIDGPYYHYSHGLKKHNGNCQRIAHGHRSKIEIWKNNKLNETLMSEWAEKWQDIYIGTQEDLEDTEDYPKENATFSYTSAQGYFLFSLPERRCCIINSDTTVELLAKYIAESIKQGDPSNHYEGKAYEGLSKGAIVEL